MTRTRAVAACAVGFALCTVALGVGEQIGLSSRAIGYWFVVATLGIYAIIGVVSGTEDRLGHYVAGRSVPAFANGLAMAVEGMGAAMFLGAVGALYTLGHEGLAYVLGWAGGYVLLAVLVAPSLRRFGGLTIPDFLAIRYGGGAARLVGLVCVVLVSFTLLVAQVTGVGIVISRGLGLPFGLGVFAGLAGILLCSMLGGMRAVTWTQVVQCLVVILAFLVPTVVMSYGLTRNPVPQLAYGQALQDMARREHDVYGDPKDVGVRVIIAERAKVIRADIDGLPASLYAQRAALQARIASPPDEATRRGLQARLGEMPSTPEAARKAWTAQAAAMEAKARPPAPYLEPPEGVGLLNFLALTACLMAGTAGLPHLLARLLTTPTIRAARSSVAWAVGAVSLLGSTAVAYAAFARNHVMEHLVGSSFARLPAGVGSWAETGLVTMTDLNGDGIVQWAEIAIHPDAVMLAAPELAGLAYVIAGLVAAGGLAAALATADGLLLTIGHGVSHDLFENVAAGTGMKKRLAVSRVGLVVVAIGAAYVAALRPGSIVETAAWACSLAASTFFPALVLGIWWRGATGRGAILGMAAGLVVCLSYIAGNNFFGMEWLGIESTAAGFFGMPANFIVSSVVSLLGPARGGRAQEFVTSIRDPRDGVAPDAAR